MSVCLSQFVFASSGSASLTNSTSSPSNIGSDGVPKHDDAAPAVERGSLGRWGRRDQNRAGRRNAAGGNPRRTASRYRRLARTRLPRLN
jgi:hypothetical protein